MADLYLDPSSNSNGSGTRADPYQFDQIASAVSSGDRLIWIPPSNLNTTRPFALDLSSFTGDLEMTVDETTASFFDHMGRTRITNSWNGANAPRYTRSLSTNPGGVAVSYGDLGDGTGRRGGILKRVANSAAVDAEAGTFFYDGVGETLHVRTFDDSDPALTAIYFNAGPGVTIGSLGGAAGEIVIRGLGFTGWAGSTASDDDDNTGLKAVATHLFLDNCEAHDCGKHTINVTTNGSVSLAGGVYGGVRGEDSEQDPAVTILVSVGGTVDVSSAKFGGHVWLDDQGASNSDQSPKHIRCLRIAQFSGTPVNRATVSDCEFRGVAGTPAIAWSITGLSAAPADPWRFEDHLARLSDVTVETCSGFWSDDASAVRRGDIDVRQGADDWATGCIDVGTNGDLLMEFCELRVKGDSSVANREPIRIGGSATFGTIRMANVSVYDESPASLATIGTTDAPTGANRPQLKLRQSILARANQGSLISNDTAWDTTDQIEADDAGGYANIDTTAYSSITNATTEAQWQTNIDNDASNGGNAIYASSDPYASPPSDLTIAPGDSFNHRVVKNAYVGSRGFGREVYSGAIGARQFRRIRRGVREGRGLGR